MLGKMSLDEIDARLAERGFELAGPYVGTTQKPTPLRCSEGHVWEARLNSVLNRGSGCPHCAGKATLTVEEIERRLGERGFELAGPYVGTTHKPTPLRCAEGHEWNGRLDGVLNSGYGCPHCSGNAPIPVEEIARRLAERGFELAGPYIGNVSTSTPLRCSEGHEWNTRLTHVLHKGTGCPHCAGNAPITVEEINARLAERGFELAGPYVGTIMNRTPLRCAEGHVWETRLNDVLNKGKGCPTCASTALTIEEIEHRLAARGIALAGDYVGTTNKPTPMRCQPCGHAWKSTLSNVFRGSGCPACARDPWRTQSIYHLHHPDIPHAYIGISTKPLVRLEEHQQDGGLRGDLARSIDEPELLTNADVFALYEAAWEEDRLPETIANWFESNPHGKLPPGRLWLADDWFTMDTKTKAQSAKVPRFVAEWVETEMIRAISENFPTRDNPFLQAGKRPLVNVAKNNAAALSC
ncbi:hypothetical protein RCXUPER_105 [Rhodobacter phage RcXuper]|nr:hypothetical protein RCXUPER_105 [Rhodobacter phage RcXuper]